MNKAAAHHTTKPAAHNAAHLQKGVLSGIRVLDFTWKTVGPWAPRLLTHYGAEVIHVERAGGWDDHRFAAHRSLTTDAPEPNHVQGEKQLYTDPYFNTLHHGKLAISLNTRHPEGIKIVERLIPKCDAIVENFSADVFPNWGLTWEHLHQLNPRRLLLDSRVVDVPMAYNPTFVMLSFLKPLFFKSLKNELHFSVNAGA